MIQDPRSKRPGLATRELLLCVAVLTVAFGLAVSLARRVRAEAAHDLARRQLAALAQSLEQSQNSGGGAFSGVPPMAVAADGPLTTGDEPALRERAAAAMAGLADLLDGPDADAPDPWGRPFAFLRRGRAEFGIAPGDGPFFFSAGPDGLYLTREDNLYSYDYGPDRPSAPAAAPTGQPVD